MKQYSTVNVVDEVEHYQNEKSYYYRPQCHYLSKQNLNKDEGIPYYPNFELKPIKIDPPSVYYQRKLQFKAPPELEYIPKNISHTVNPEKLSESQKPFAGKTLFEKDLIIIEQRNQLQAKSMKSHPSNHKNHRKRSKSVNFHAKKKVIIDTEFNIEEEEEEVFDDYQLFSNPPNVFYREEEKRQLIKAEREKQIKLLQKRQKRQENRIRQKFEEEKKKIDSIAKERETERIIQEQIMNEEKEKELQKRKEKYEIFKQNPLRSTRATNLRTEATNHKIEVDRANQQKEKLNSQLKRKRLKKQTKKIASLIKSMNQDYNIECRARQKMEEMKKTERGWYRWLDKNEKSNEKKETMLERTLFATD